MTVLETYRRAQDAFDAVLASVAQNQWDSPSTCPGWTIRDVAGHVIWGQEQMRHWAIGEEYSRTTGAPGAPHPGELAGADPLETWRSARAESGAALTVEALGRMITLPGLGAVPLTTMVTTWVTDHLAHTWDIGHALGEPVALDRDLVAGSFAWMRERTLRAPGFFGPELTPPDDADEQTRWLAFLGRAAWQPAPA